MPEDFDTIEPPRANQAPQTHKKRPPVHISVLNDLNGSGDKLIIARDGGLLKASIENAGILLEYHPEIMGRLQFNAFTVQANVTRAFPWDPPSQGTYPRELTDSDATNFCRWLERHGQYGVSKEKAFSVLGAVAEANSYHPLQDYLAFLDWDHRPRLDSWLSYYLGVEFNKYTSAVGRKFLIGAVARAMRPGSKMDTMLIFEGAQGIGKSTAARVLFGDEYFTDSLSPIGNKDAAQELGGKWCIEIAELGQFVKVDQRHIKEMLSKCTDRYRPPYGRMPREFPRHCVFVGTYNPTGDGPLKDETGARRFWPVVCGSIDLEALADERDQIWAEAVRAFESGEKWWLDDEENELAEVEQKARYDEDPWQQTVEEYLVGLQWATTHKVLIEALKLDVKDLHDGHKKRVSRIMTVLGWKCTPEKVAGKTMRVYRPAKLVNTLV